MQKSVWGRDDYQEGGGQEGGQQGQQVVCICAENTRRDAHLMEVVAGVGEVTARKEEESGRADSRPRALCRSGRRVEVSGRGLAGVGARG